MKNNLIRSLFFTLVLIICSEVSSAQVPMGFNYQAIAKDIEGKVLPDLDLLVRIAILQSEDPLIILWEEEHTIKTNQNGLFQLVVGDIKANPIGGEVGSFAEINWLQQPLYLRTKILFKGEWLIMGNAQLFSVPYALVSGNISGTLPRLSVSGKTTLMDEALFEVKNNLNQTIFAVYNEGVRIYVDNGDAKGPKGGFAVGGFGGNKGSQEFLRVTADSTRIYTNDNPAKGVKGGFAVGGYDGVNKAATGNFLNLTKDNYFIGHESGSKIPKVSGGLYNSVIGYQAGKSLTSGGNNTILGHLAGTSTTSGNNNILIGDMAGLNLTTGQHNTLIGSSAGKNHTDQEFNVMIGTSSGSNINAVYWNGSFNTFLGINSGYQIRNSKENVFLGTNAGYWLDNGQGNTFVGIDAGRSRNESGEPWAYRSGVKADFNTIIGDKAGYFITNGDSNLFVGSMSGYSNADGTGNIFLGNRAGYYETGSNKLYIANSKATPPLIYGDFSIKKLGVNTKTLNKTLNVGGDIEASGSISSASVTSTGNISATTVTANVTGNLTGNVTGNLTGLVNGISAGKIYSATPGELVSADGYILSWDVNNEEILLSNSGATACGFWYRIQEGTVTKGNTGVIQKGEKYSITGWRSDFNGFEIHFGQADGPSGWCSVWLQFMNGKMAGHYIKN